eukprot:gnl/Spiro4/13926_TR7450_c0_g1_i1.p1 gnl/Spiro4/13926_TR7450_c0_g1~~gnl/Spiro4/13926_TR7450_c0_g1_i1.p1  ORF type:complete len:346 (+),score=37.17 gnl/Spiro4/13926_TR7450_c0_g1_i1:5140-6177(+)
MLRAMYSFDHCAKSSNLSVGNTVNPAVGFGYSNATLLGTANMGVGADGFIGGYSSGANVNMAFDMTGIIPPNPTKVTFGWRVKTLQVYASTHAMISFSVPASPNDTTAYLTPIGSGNTPWVPAVGGEVYVEMTYDFTTFTASTIINGVPVGTTQGPAPNAAQKAAFVSGAWTINFVLANTLNARYAYRDFYILDAVAGDGMVAPLGPQKLFPIFLDAADGAGWTATGAASPMDVLNTALPANPYTTSPADKTPLVTSLKTSAPVGSRVNAVNLSLSGTSAGDSASTSKIELIQGGQTLAPKFAAVQKTITYGVPIGLFAKAPDGGSWDLNKIDATTLKLTPDTAV